MKDRYIFPAIFHCENDGISIEFPDLPGCLPCANTMEEAFRHAKEAMALHLFGMEEDGDPIPEPADINILMKNTKASVTLIEVWMPPFRSEMKNKAVKKTLTIPQWLDDLAKENKVNYSQILQEALKKHLGV